MEKRVVVVPYSEQWKADFETIKQYVLPAINDVVIGIEHIGSTSVEGISAKPIIDIDIKKQTILNLPEHTIIHSYCKRI